MLRMLLIAAAGLVADAGLAADPALAAGPAPPPPQFAACHGGVRHISLLSPAQMCPRPLATTIIAPPRHLTLRT